MDFLDPKKKRAHRIRLFIGYGLMTIALGIGTMLLVFQAYGFDFDRETGEVIQNGLVFVDAHPEQAEVFINGENKGRTDQRLVIPSGAYSLELRSEGYRPWKRDFELEGGSIARFVYPFLFPDELVIEDSLELSSAPSLVTSSPDRRWLMVQQPGSLTDFTLFDLNPKQDVQTTIAVPAGIFTPDGDDHRLSEVEWSTDNRRLLVEHNFSGNQEFVVLDRQAPDQSVNLTRLFASTPFTQIVLRDKKFDRYYLYNATTKVLFEAELANGGRAATLLNNILSFRSHDDDVLLYVTTEGASMDKVLAKVRDDQQDYLLREMPANTNYLLDVARFDGKWFMVVGNGTEKRAFVYENPVNEIRRRPELRLAPIASLKLLDNIPTFISFSANARIIALQGGSEFAVYDAETEETHHYDTKLSIAVGEKAQWMDGHRLTLISETKLNVFDFDGLNMQTLIPCSVGYRPFFDRDYTALYCMAPASNPDLPTGVSLTSTKLLLEE